ncbi:MAG: PQQ-dependent sugar dehydrogenase, partial [Bacteroidota bacterium]
SLAFDPFISYLLFMNELQSGKIRFVQDGVLLEQAFAQVETNVTGSFPVQGENGLVGLAFDPDYASNKYVYITYAYRTLAGETFGRIARFTDQNNIGTDFTILLDNLPSAPGHQIQSLAFGPDDKLYVSVSDAFVTDLNEVQELDNFLGKFLRMNKDGSIPDDNPFPNSYIYAYGFRNFYDFVFRENGDILQAENGPDFNDELNVLEAGKNYGFPNAIGLSSNPIHTNPIRIWGEIVAPTGMAINEGNQFPSQYQGNLFLSLFGETFNPFISNRNKRILAIGLSGNGQSTTTLPEEFVVYNQSVRGNPLDVTFGPDGSLYFSDIFQEKVFKVSVE